MPPSEDPQDPTRTARQWGKLAPGYLRGLLDVGVPVRAFRTLAHLSLHVSGNPDGVEIYNDTLAQAVGYSKRTIQRDVAALEMATAARLARSAGASVPHGLDVDRKLRPLPGDTWELGGVYNRPNRYSLPQISKRDYGTVIHRDLVEHPAYQAATATAAGVYLFLIEHLGGAWRPLAARALAKRLGLALATVREALRYWRRAGLLKVDTGENRPGPRLANRYRAVLPWLADTGAGLAIAAERACHSIAHVAKWCGQVITKRATEISDLWQTIDDPDQSVAVVGDLVDELRALRKAGRYQGPVRARDVGRALRQLLAERHATAGAPGDPARAGPAP